MDILILCDFLDKNSESFFSFLKSSVMSISFFSAGAALDSMDES